MGGVCQTRSSQSLVKHLSASRPARGSTRLRFIIVDDGEEYTDAFSLDKWQRMLGELVDYETYERHHLHDDTVPQCPWAS